MVKSLSDATGITTTDMRLLLMVDDWKDTFKKILVKGTDAFKDLIPYGNQISGLVKELLPLDSSKPQVQTSKLGESVSKFL